MNVNPLKWISSSLIAILNVSLLLVSFQNCSGSNQLAAAQVGAPSGSVGSVRPLPPQTAAVNEAPVSEPH